MRDSGLQHMDGSGGLEKELFDEGKTVLRQRRKIQGNILMNIKYCTLYGEAE